ncbi:AsmA family protein [Aestuariirhabdus sp. Z084]|uniref:AsmA family protein n=1 Tax=Aestuariirhabdus haliotis TaxID=2918751 RepID=UPI00201B402E|nr:AsmA family protein [Aestuariirhabdus haliotis]MCL6416098.1 AsmA family protein [Aestuariirhabdus haliotis]MCL6420145.1 AsmA family protein [Aestuariirhabdus haliotis]
MKTLLKVSLIILALVALLLIAALVIIPLLVNPNDYKPQLQQLVHEQTGMELVIDGDIGLSIFPVLGFELEQLALTNQQQPLAQLGYARAALRLLPLLSGTVEMQALELDGLDLNLVKDAQGQANWTLPPASSQQPQPVTKQPPTDNTAVTQAAPQEQASDQQPIALNIDQVRILNISVHYRDQQQGQDYRLDKMSLQTGAIVPGQPFALELEFNLTSQSPVLGLQTRLSAQTQFDLIGQRYRLNQLQLDGQLSGEATASKTVPISLQGDIDLDLNRDTLRLDNLALSLANLKAFSTLQVASLEPIKYQGQVELPAFDLKALLDALGQPAIDTRNPKALKAISLQADLSGNDNSVAFNKLSLGLDNSQFNGQVSLPDIANQALRFTLKGDHLNLDDYQPPTNDQSGSDNPAASGSDTSQQQRTTKPSWDDSPLLPVETLKTLNIIGALTLDQLVASGVTVSEADLKFSARKGLLKLERLSGTAFDGQFNKNATLDLNRSPITISANVTMEKVDISEVLKLATPEEPAARGRASINTRITARGNSQYKIINSLNGTTRFNISEGALLGSNLNKLVCSAVARVRKKDLAEQQWADETPFKQLGGSFNIVNGVATNRDLIASMNNLKLGGDGAINLPKRRFDYHLGLTLLGNQADQDEACQINEQYGDIVWPVRCRGPFDGGQGQCGIDQERLANEIGKQAVREGKKRLNKKLDKVFKKWFEKKD